MSLSVMLQQLASGMVVSVEIFVVTLIFSLPLGLLICFGRMAKNPVIRGIVSAYISVMRGTPLMLQLMVVYFGPEVEKALKRYLEVRENIIPLEGHEHALFYSAQRRRIGVQAIENLVKKYSQQITTTKKITPHKLRSTYGTALYQETGDIYLVADVLGHKDVNTTKKHYAAIDDARRRQAAKAVKLRED